MSHGGEALLHLNLIFLFPRQLTLLLLDLHRLDAWLGGGGGSAGRGLGAETHVSRDACFCTEVSGRTESSILKCAEKRKGVVTEWQKKGLLGESRGVWRKLQNLQSLGTLDALAEILADLSQAPRPYGKASDCTCGTNTTNTW